MIRATIDINGAIIARLVCQNISGGLGWCRYACWYETDGKRREFEVRHYRPSGAPALIAAAMGMLAEAGIGQAQQTFDVTRSEEADDERANHR